MNLVWHVGQLWSAHEAALHVAVIDIDHSKFTGALKRVPGLKDVPYPVQMEPNLVIEFYSR